MKAQRGFTIVELIVVVLGLASIIGWVWNIVKLSQMNFEPITTMLIIRIAGILVAPLGVVVGYL